MYLHLARTPLRNRGTIGRPLHHACKNFNYVCKMWYRMNLPGPGGVRRSMSAAVGQAELSRPECQLYGNRRRRPDPEAKGRTPI